MSERKKSITIKDIAARFGVTPATVSRALNDSPRISLQRREEIQKYARENNFSPNIMAASLRSRTVMKIIGVIIPQFTHFYFSSILCGIEEEASKRGYQLMVASSEERYEREVEICDAFLENKVCGIIVSQAKSTNKYDHFEKLIRLGMPLVFYDRICTGVDASRVVVDDYNGAFAAVEYLISLGCRRIAYYGSPVNLEISKNRYNGWRDALLRHKINPKDCIYRDCDNGPDAESITREVMSGDDRPDAFFAVNDDTAIGIMYTIKRMGFRVPEDISVCGFTNGQRAQACDPKLTTVEQNGMEIGRQAASILIGKAERRMPIEKVERCIVRTRLVVRDSTRAK
ncbi:MAG: LacI family transcriptional regulator [Prevotella sp.]|nr:LacI family transcriptional regulator [Prevotella sp.]